jgi:hypothetical protein
MFIAPDTKNFNSITWYFGPKSENADHPLAASLKKRMIVFNSDGEMIRPAG